MSRRRDFFRGWYVAPPKQPVPADGIAARRFGVTWWGREWIASLERLGRSWANRLPRGRSYARQGRVVDLEIGAGVVTAGVVGTRRSPYRVEIGLPAHPPEVWGRALEALAEDVLVVARLLDRQLPDEVGERLAAAGIDLFPRQRELRTRCSCPDVANPCKHVAAVHYVIAAALDNDPFLLFRLRGVDRDGLLAALGAGATDDAAPAAAAEDDDESHAAETAPEIDVDAFLGRDLALPALDVEPRPPEAPLVGLRRLGPPPRGLERLPDLLAPCVRAASRLALELAWAESGPEKPPPRNEAETASQDAHRPDEGRRRGRRPASRRPRGQAGGRRELVGLVEAAVAEAKDGLSKRELVARLGADTAAVTAALTELRAARLVVTRGRGPATRYRLAAHARTAPRRGRRPGRSPRTQADDIAARLVEVLRAEPSALPLRVLAERLGASPEDIRPALLALRQNGVVEMVGRRRSARYRFA